MEVNVTGRQRLVRRCVNALKGRAERAVDTECEVPGCDADADFDAPGYWCEPHWRSWWQWPESDSEPEWMSNPESRANSRNEGIPK